MNDKIKNLKDVLELVNKPYFSVEDGTRLFATLIKLVKDLKDENNSKYAEMIDKVENVIANHKNISKDTEFSTTYFKNEITSLKKIISNLKLKHGKDGKDADPIDTAKLAIEASEIALGATKELIQKIPPITKDLPKYAGIYRDALETLKDEDRLSASAIKDLPEFVEKTHQTAAFGVREAPRDGKTYGRNNRSWVEVPSEADTLQTVTDRGATTTNEITLPSIKAKTSAGLAIKADNGDTAVLIGASGGKNATFYDGVKLDAGTASRVLVTDANKNITQSAMTATDLDAIPTSYLTLNQTTPQTVTGTPTFPVLITPKIYPSADSTTAVGIFKADGTTNVLNVDTTNGNVGIGTTSPIYKLDVQGTTVSSAQTPVARFTQLQTTNGYSNPVVIRNNDTSLYSTSAIGFQNAAGSTVVQIGAAGSTYVNAAYPALTANGSFLYTTGNFGMVSDSDTGRFDFQIGHNAASLKMSILANGNVGIGTTAPGALLNVNGVGLFGATTIPSSASANSRLVVARDGGNTGIDVVGSASGFPFMEFNRSRGTVTSPTTVVDGDQLGAFLAGGYSGASTNWTTGIEWFVDGTVSTNVVPTRMTFSTGTGGSRVERMRITSAGNVGIGTTTPGSKLTVSGHIGSLGTIPTLTSAGTGASITTGSTDTAGEITQGTTATGAVITFATAYTNIPFAVVTSQAGLAFSYTVSTTAITITNIGALSETKLNYHVIARE